MKKYFLLTLCLLLLAVTVSAQKPERIYGKNQVLKTNDYYLQQMELWKKETEKDPANADAWLNYYRASRNSYIVGEEKDTPESKGINRFARLQDIVMQMEKNVPGSYEYNFVKWSNGGLDNSLFPYLQKAHELAPLQPDPISSLIYYYEIKGDYAERDKNIAAYYELANYSPGLLNYAYNMLSGLDRNAIIFTEGDKDTDATFILQSVKGIRKDVRLLNMNLLLIKEYREHVFKELEIAPLDFDPLLNNENFEKFRLQVIEHVSKNKQQRPVYVGKTVRNPYLEPIKDKLYLTGLASVYSKTKIDNIALLKKNYEELYATDYLKTYLPHDISEGNVHQFNWNYISSLALLYDHYVNAGDAPRADKYRSLAKKIAEDAGRPDEFEELFKKK